jgi:hypothetical protein
LNGGNIWHSQHIGFEFHITQGPAINIIKMYLFKIRDAPDIRSILISGIRPDTKLVSRISGQISGKAGYRISG